MKLKYTLAALVMALGSVAQAQDGPSYEETVAFLQTKLNTERRYASGSVDDQKLIEVGRCQIATVNSSTIYSMEYGEIHNIFIQYLPLQNLDPGRVRVTVRPDGRFGDSVTVSSRSNVPLPFTYLDVSDWDYLKIHCNSTNYYEARLAQFPALTNFIGIPEQQRYCSPNQPALHHSGGLGNILHPADDNAPRVQRALQHLIRLCGGREELF